MTIVTGYLHHGSANNPPMAVEAVRVRHIHGNEYQAFFEGRWRKVHVKECGDFIVFQGEPIPVTYEGNT